MKRRKCQKLEQLYEGKAKKVFRTDDPELYIVDYKDDATAFNGQKKGTIASKGVVNNKMSAIIFQQLEENGVPTHLVRLLSDRETLVKAVKILPLEVIIRNVAAGSFSQEIWRRRRAESWRRPFWSFPIKMTVLEIR